MVPQNEFLPLCDLLFNIISLAAYFCDIVFDLVVAYALFERGKLLWFAATLFFVGFSLVICQAISCRWYLRSIDTRETADRVPAKLAISLVHVLQLGVLWRYFKLFMPVDLRYVKFEVRDLCILRLVHAFCQSAPLLLIQLHLLMNERYDQEFTDLNVVSVSLSLFSVCWALASFSKNVRMHNVHKLVLTWLGVIFQFLWRLGTVSCRVLCLVYYSSAHGPWLLVVVVLHWVVVFLWLVCPGLGPGLSTTSGPAAAEHVKGGALRATWLAAALASLHLIAYASVSDHSSRLRAVMFYVVMGVENLVLLISWYLTVRPTYVPLLPIGAIFSYVLGLLFMVLYYRFFHVRRLKYEAGGRMSTPDNVSSELGAGATTEISGSLPSSRAVSTPVKEEPDSPPKLPIKHQPTRYRYYGQSHRHGGIPGVFNCRFTNPYTAAMTKRKKKKPTSFVPPPSVVPNNHCPLPFWCRPLVSEERTSSPLHRLDEKKRQQIESWQAYPQQLTPAYLRFLATGERFQYLHFNLRVGASTVGKIVSETCVAIWEVLSPKYLMQDLTPNEWLKIADRFEELWNFPNCCGAIDGKHIRIEAPWNSGSMFFNYKSYNSIILQAVVDAEGKFIVVDVGEAGKNSDGGVFISSTFGRLFNDMKLKLPKSRTSYRDKPTLFPYVFVGDEAYALHKHMMKPFAKASLTRERRIYNYPHSRARRIVECAIGMLAKKFRVFETALLVHPDKAKEIVLACCVLHNIIRTREGRLQEVYDEIMNVEETCDTEQDAVRARAAKAAYKVGDCFAEYFNSPSGAVPWQDEMALV